MTGDRRLVIIVLTQLDHIKAKIFVLKISVSMWACVCMWGSICQTSLSQWLCKVLYYTSAPAVKYSTVLTWFVTNCLKSVFYGCVMASWPGRCLQVALNLSLNFFSFWLYLPPSLSLMVNLILLLIQNQNDPSFYICIIYHPPIVAICDLTLPVTGNQMFARGYMSNSL